MDEGSVPGMMDALLYNYAPIWSRLVVCSAFSCFGALLFISAKSLRIFSHAIFKVSSL